MGSPNFSARADNSESSIVPFLSASKVSKMVLSSFYDPYINKKYK